MKKTMVTFLSFMLIGILAACGTDDNDDTSVNEQSETPAEQEDTSGTEDDMAETEDENDPNTNEDSTQAADDKNEKMKQLEFAEIDLEVEYADNKDYDAEIEKRSSGEYKSELEDELNNQYLKGDEAFNHIYPIVEKLNINPDSTKDEVIKEILQAFELEENYREFEVEIIFHDGTKVEFED